MPLEVRGATASAAVTLNGKLTERMLVDTGATWVTLPWAVAQQVGATPGPKGPVATTTTIADGSVVDARRVTLKSMRVGAFVAQDLECVVMPKGMKNAPMLLGGRFLRNFVVRVDLAKSQIHLTRVGARAVREVGGPADAAAWVIVEPGFAALFSGKDVDGRIWGRFKSGDVAKEGAGCNVSGTCGSRSCHRTRLRRRDGGIREPGETQKPRTGVSAVPGVVGGGRGRAGVTSACP